MSFKRTGNDLCADKVVLDYQALLRTTRIAYALELRAIGKCLQELSQYTRFEDIQGTWACIQAHNLEDEAMQFSIVAETLHALQEGLTRHEVKIANKPEIEEDREGS